MGVFGRFFGEKKAEAVEVSLEESPSFIEAVLSEKRKGLLDSSAKSVAEIRHVLLETRSSLDALVSAQAVARSKRLEKIAETSRNSALVQLGSLLDKLNPPNTGDLEALRAYALDSIEALRQSSVFGKNVAYAGISFRDELKAVSGSFHRLADLFSSLKELFDGNAEVFLRGSFDEKMASLAALEAEVSSLEKAVASGEAGLAGLSSERAGLEASLRRLGESEGFKEIAELNGRKAGLLRDKQAAKTELLDLFARVEKPLHRLAKAVRARKVFLAAELASLLDLILANPFKALKRDPKAVSVKAVLAEARAAIESNVVELKERDREKKLAVLGELLSFDFFAKSFWRLNRIDSDILAVEKRLESLPAVSEEKALLASLSGLSGKISSLEADLEAKRADLSASRSRASSLRVAVQSVLCRASGKRVVLRG